MQEILRLLENCLAMCIIHLLDHNSFNRMSPAFARQAFSIAAPQTWNYGPPLPPLPPSSNNCPLPLPMGGSEPHLIHGSLGLTKCKTQTASQLFQPILHSFPQSVPIRYNGPSLLSSKLPLPVGRFGPTSNKCFLGHIQVLNPNSIFISSAICAGLSTVTDRPTDRPRHSVGNNRSHLRM